MDSKISCIGKYEKLLNKQDYDNLVALTKELAHKGFVLHLEDKCFEKNFISHKYKRICLLAFYNPSSEKYLQEFIELENKGKMIGGIHGRVFVIMHRDKPSTKTGYNKTEKIRELRFVPRNSPTGKGMAPIDVIFIPKEAKKFWKP